MVIAVDFDGTIVEHKYPAIGRELPFATETLRMLIRNSSFEQTEAPKRKKKWGIF